LNTRILHCSTSLENYYLCLEHRVAGFSNRGPQPGDQVYLVVKVGKKSLCGARFILEEPTDNKPWADADSYVNALSVSNIEFCKAGSSKNPTSPISDLQGICYSSQR
jgi:hypothetical protein